LHILLGARSAFWTKSNCFDILTPVVRLSSGESETIAWLGTGPFFGELTYFANKRLAENMDLSPSRNQKEQNVTGSKQVSRGAEKQPLSAFAEKCHEGRCFTGIVGRGIELHEIEFFQCRFDGCQFLESVFRQCCFEQCVFEKCDLSMMKPLGSRFTGVRFLKSKMLGVDWTLAAVPASLAFQGCNVSHSTFQRLTLQKVELTECIAREVDFTGTNLTKANFAGTDFLGSRFMDTNLSGVDFSRAANYAIDPTANRLKKAIFSLPEALSLLSTFDIVLK
jgi:uncharacterized protein YjbI with pentapeptide repeats